MKKVRNFNLKIALTTIILAVSVIFGITLSVNPAYALTATTNETLVMPCSTLEYRELVSPVDVYSNDKVTAIIQNENPTNLLVYLNGSFSSIEAQTLTDVALLDENTLIYSTEARIKKINLVDFDTTDPTSSVSAFPLDQGDTIATTYFALNDEYIITAYETNLKVFRLNDLERLHEFNIDTNCRIAINDNGNIFYVSGGKICTRSLTDTSIITELVSAYPTAMIADNENIYYIENGKIFRISVNGGSVEELSVVADDANELGNLENPVNLFFKNENLLITDSSMNAVQEFTLSNDNLEFTGFAIAKGKTAYNRVSNQVKGISRYSNNLVIADQTRLTVIDKSANFNTYDKTAFTHYDYDKLGITIPDSIVTGQDETLLLFNKNTENSSLRSFNLLNGELSDPVTVFSSNYVREIAHANGKFFIIADDNNGFSSVYQADASLSEFNKLLDGEVYFSSLTVDLSGTIYLKSADEKLFKATKGEQGYELSELPTLNGVIKLATDLGRNLYALTSQSIVTLNNDVWETINLPQTFTTNSAVDFALGFENSEIMLYYQNEEFLTSLTGIGNLAIDEIKVPDAFITTDKNANLSSFKVYALNNDNQAFSVVVGETFSFSNPAKQTEQLLFVCEIVETDSFDRQTTLYALLNLDEVVLAYPEQLVEITPATQTEVPKTAFVTTAVHAYYLPIITPNDLYVITDGQKIRLSAKQLILPNAKIALFDKEFYFAQVELNDKTVSCYIPVSFTVEILSQDFIWQEHSLIKVNATSVYLDQELTQKITSLKDGTSVRLISKNDGVAEIAFKTENGWARAYMRTNAIKNPANTAIRNVLIIIAVMASVCGTTTYFVLRKKR